MQRTVQPSAKVSARTDRPANLHDPHGQLEDESRRQLGQSCDVNAPRLPQRRQPLACTMDSRAAPDHSSAERASLTTLPNSSSEWIGVPTVGRPLAKYSCNLRG